MPRSASQLTIYLEGVVEDIVNVVAVTAVQAQNL